MAKQNHRNDSSQVKDLIQFNDPQPDTNQKPKQEHHSDSSQMDLMQLSDSESDTNQKPKQKTSQSRSNSTDHPSSSSHSPSTWDCAEDAGRTDNHEQMKTQSSEGALSCQLEDLKRLSQCDIKLGRLTFSRSHTVLIDVEVFNCKAGPIPQAGRELWHRNFVKMPCSPSSSFVTSKPWSFNGPSQMRRWEVISKHLSALACKKAVRVDDVEKAILNYNPKYKGQWSFAALSQFVGCVPDIENYYVTLFPKIAALALKLPEQVKKAIPLLQSGHNASITLSQVQISCLLANAFYCTFPHRNASRPDAEYHNYPSINFTGLFGNWSERKKEKLRAIMHYFRVVTETELNGLVTFQRCSLKDTEVPNWRTCNDKLHKLHVTSRGKIEDKGTGMLQVDFASSWIGGGVLDSGLVQEEILFLMNPELIVSRLFTEKLADRDCLIVTGSQQFSSYSGYSDSFEWAGPHEDNLERDKWSRFKRQILAIDALHFKHRLDQYNMRNISRELNKAYCGFKKHHEHEEPDIATGNWGCGAFKGDPKLKALIQLMAAAKAKKGLAFFTFNDEELKKELEQIYHLLVKEETRVGKLYELLEDFCANQRRTPAGSSLDLFEFIRKTIGCYRSNL